MNEGILAGADIGGSHISVAMIDTRTWEVLMKTRRRKEINPNRNSEEIFNAWSQLIKESFYAANTKPSDIGIAMPGPFDYINGISYIRDQNKYDSLYGLNVKEKLAEKLATGVRNITILNDAACFLQGEMAGGAGKGFRRVMGLTLGTGFGSARSLDGETVDADLWCSGYKDGIAEDYLSTRWFLKRYKELSGVEVKNVKELTTRTQKDGMVQHVFDEFGNNLADFLSPYIKKEELELVILGGNISLAFPYFSKTLNGTFEQREIQAEIRTTKLGENAALIGAASSHFQSAGFIQSK